MENGVILGRPHDESYMARDGETTLERDETALYVEYHRMGGENEFFAEKILVETEGTSGGTWYDPVEGMIGSMEFDDEWTMNPNTGSWGPGDLPFDDNTTGDYGGRW